MKPEKAQVVFVYYGDTVGNEKMFADLARSRTRIHMIDLDHLTIKQRYKVLLGITKTPTFNLNDLFKGDITEKMQSMSLQDLLMMVAKDINLIRTPIVLNECQEVHVGYYRVRPLETITGRENKIF